MLASIAGSINSAEVLRKQSTLMFLLFVFFHKCSIFIVMWICVALFERFCTFYFAIVIYLSRWIMVEIGISVSRMLSKVKAERYSLFAVFAVKLWHTKTIVVWEPRVFFSGLRSRRVSLPIPVQIYPSLNRRYLIKRIRVRYFISQLKLI